MNTTRSLAFAVLFASMGAAYAQGVISFCSGENLGIGVQDSRVGWLRASSPGGNFGPFTPADFANAQAGPRAWTVAPVSAWTPASALAANAQWINTDPDPNVDWTALYAHTFLYNSSAPVANITVRYLVDDTMGGIYLNGSLLPGSTGGTYNAITTKSWINVPMLANQNNTLFFYARNPGINYSGLAYCAEIAPVPEPGTLLAVGAGIAGLIARRRRRRS